MALKLLRALAIGLGWDENKFNDVSADRTAHSCGHKQRCCYCCYRLSGRLCNVWAYGCGPIVCVSSPRPGLNGYSECGHSLFDTCCYVLSLAEGEHLCPKMHADTHHYICPALLYNPLHRWLVVIRIRLSISGCSLSADMSADILHLPDI